MTDTYEAELMKGCGFATNGFRNACGGINGLCPTCKAKLEAYQKGKDAQKKEEIEFLREIFIMDGVSEAFSHIYNRIERLTQAGQKEIKECQHELSNCLLLSNPPLYQCKKCGKTSQSMDLK